MLKTTSKKTVRRTTVGRGIRPKQVRKFVPTRGKRPGRENKTLSGAFAGAPVAIGSSYRASSSMPDEYIRGNDFLTTIKATTSTADGSIIYNYFVSPTTVNARLQAIGHTWERYQFRKLGFRFIPAVPTSTPGALTFAYDPDSTDVTPLSYTRETLYALDDNVSSSVYAPCELQVRHLDTKTLYYTGSNSLTDDERFELQGQLYVAYTGPAFEEDTVLGTVMIEYEVYFTKRCYESVIPSTVPTLEEAGKSVGGDYDVLAGKASGILSKAYDLGMRLTGGKFELGPRGIGPLTWQQVANTVDLAVSFLSGSSAATAVGLRAHLKNATGSANLAFDYGKIMHSILVTEYDSRGGAVVGAAIQWCVYEAPTNLPQHICTGINTFRVEPNTIGLGPYFIDFTIDDSGVTAPLTGIILHGVELTNLSIPDYQARFQATPVTTSSAGIDSRSVSAADKSHLVFPAQNPDVASMSTSGRSAAAAASATPLGLGRR